MKKTIALITLISSINLCFASSTIGELYDSYAEGKKAKMSYERTPEGKIKIYAKYPNGLVPGLLCTAAGAALVAISSIERCYDQLDLDYSDRMTGLILGIPMVTVGALVSIDKIVKYHRAQTPLLILGEDGLWFRGNVISGEKFMPWNEIEDITPMHGVTLGITGFEYKTHGFKVVNAHTVNINLSEKDMAINHKQLKSFLIEFLQKHAPEKAERLKLSPLI